MYQHMKRPKKFEVIDRKTHNRCWDLCVPTCSIVASRPSQYVFI